MSRLTKSFRGVVLVACLLLVAPASALADCGTKVVDDYLNDGTIDGSYSQACYKSALQQIPPDADLYTDVRGSIVAAMNRGTSGGTGGTQQSSNAGTTAKPGTTVDPTTGEATTDGGTTTDLLPVTPGTTDAGIVGQALNDIGPKHADEVPMPVIILGGLAALLILAGAGGLIAQRMSRRGQDPDGPEAPPAETAV